MPHSIYQQLRQQAKECAAYTVPIEQVCIGLVWTLVRVGDHTGLCMTPSAYSRTLDWSGELVGRPACELIAWLDSWQPHEGALAVATLNAVLQSGAVAKQLIGASERLGAGNLALFEALAPQLKGQRLSVVGRYPGLDRVLQGLDYQCIERQPGAGDLPDPAAEYLLPQSDWNFITASALANKTLPRLLALGQSGRTVLMGPSLPWSRLWAAWGVAYLAGIEVLDADRLWQVVAEGGGVRIFDAAVCYRLLSLQTEGVA